MEILWLLAPVFPIGYLLFKPFIVAVFVGFLAADNKRNAKAIKIVVFGLLVAFTIYLNFNHPKEYPMLFRIPEALAVLLYFYVYVKILNLISRKATQSRLAEVQENNKKNEN